MSSGMNMNHMMHKSQPSEQLILSTTISFIPSTLPAKYNSAVQVATIITVHVSVVEDFSFFNPFQEA